MIGIGAAVLSHVAPFPFLFDITDNTVWRMPATEPPTIYLTFDDGPNADITPHLLDVLKEHAVSATFFVINRYITDDTVPIVRRMFEDGHAVALHSHTRRLMVAQPGIVAATLQEMAARWGLMLWDVTLFGERTDDALVRRFVSHASPGDIVVMHDGDDDNSAPSVRRAHERVRASESVRLPVIEEFRETSS
jgi:chitooligosaccharide deacetylase